MTTTDPHTTDTHTTDQTEAAAGREDTAEAPVDAAIARPHVDASLADAPAVEAPQHPHAYGGPPSPQTEGEHREARPSPRGVQSVKFSFYRVSDHLRGASKSDRAKAGKRLTALLERSAERMLTRVYSTVGTRRDADFLVWQVHDDLETITDWHAELLRSPLTADLERPYSYLSMTMRSMYTNPLHEGSEGRDRLRPDGGDSQYLFVYPMAKTRAWYTLPQDERQRIMNEHIAIGHKYHGIKINTTYSYGLDDQEFVVAFEGDEPGDFLALVRELRDSESSSYTLFDTPMFTARRMGAQDLIEHIGLAK
ncbi:MAG: chlorite dismutase [Dehalococcoidia bacterium]|nr:chlorite dismutase [Dehalococcoidia bacterium]